MPPVVSIHQNAIHGSASKPEMAKGTLLAIALATLALHLAFAHRYEIGRASCRERV